MIWRIAANGLNRVLVTAAVTALIYSNSGAVSPAHAQVNGVMEVPVVGGTQSDVQWVIVPFAWLLSIDGDVGISGFTTDLDINFSDAATKGDSLFGAMLHVEASTKDWSVFLTTSFVRLGVDDISGAVGPVGVSVDTTSNLGWIEFGGVIPVIGGSPTTYRYTNDPDLKVDAYAGARITVIHLELDTDATLFGIPVSSASSDITETWVEPIIGLRTSGHLTEDVLVQLRGDIGGFGVGSDFAWHAVATLAYEWELFDRPAIGFLGYRAISQDYDSGGFEWDATAHGPIFGIKLVF
jgi:hypothetical protein